MNDEIEITPDDYCDEISSDESMGENFGLRGT
jgi:hypothetical protein